MQTQEALVTQEVAGSLPTHLIGYEINFVPDTGAVVAALRTDEGRADHAVLCTIESSLRLSRQRAKQLGDALCHAVNSGMDPDMLVQMAQNMAELAKRNDFMHCSFASPLGLVIDTGPQLRYVSAIDDGVGEIQLLVIRPKISSEIMSMDEFASTCNAY